ncbi:MAG: YggS family pyridoxal phosphate-dependent enzyme [Chloroflexota bacterium]|nr:YggS family pyridoxal phosphate-dependent enzyme [Chloroflexota bacterium]
MPSLALSNRRSASKGCPATSTRAANAATTSASPGRRSVCPTAASTSRRRIERPRTVTSVSESWWRVCARVAAAAERAGRKPEDVAIVAVSKTFPIAAIREAYELGVRVFGENRVQEALEKMPLLPDGIQWHLVGHLQTNKVRQAVGRFWLIHSVDSVHLAEEIERQAAKRTIDQRVLLEVNLADEPSKSGFSLMEVGDAISEVRQMPHVRLEGLMTIGPQVEEPEDSRWLFETLRELRDRLQAEHPELALTELSMGMTDDFEVAVEEGATLVRIGRAIFGERTVAQPTTG